MALEAVGATVVPTPGLLPDPVVPGPLKKGVIAEERWVPPAHDPPALSA